MRLMATRTTGFQAEAKDEPPFGPGFSDSELRRAKSMEIWGSTFDDDEGEGDFCRFILKDESGKQIAARIIAGY